MTTKTIILDFQLSNNFEKYESHINAKQEELIFNEIGVGASLFSNSSSSTKTPVLIFFL